MNKDAASGDSGRSARLLAGFVAAAVLCIVLTNYLTRPRAEAARERQMANALASVLADTPHDNQPTDDVFAPHAVLPGPVRWRAVHRVRLEGRPVAAVLDIEALDGYSGGIGLLIGLTVEGRIIAVRVTEHRETPGLGDRIEYRRSNWIEQFAGRSLAGPDPELDAGSGPASVASADFDALSGATITARAVVTAVNDALIWFNENREQVFDNTAEQAMSDPGAS